MSTKNKWLIGIGIVVLLAVMYALPFVWQAINPAYGSGYGMTLAPHASAGVDGRGGMMGGGFYGMYSGMMGYGFGFGFMWLIPLALLTLLGLSIAALIKYLRSA